MKQVRMGRLFMILMLLATWMTGCEDSNQRSEPNGREALLKSEATLKESLYVMRTAINAYHSDKGRYPSDLETLVSENYLRRIPVDPITRSKSTWIIESAKANDDRIAQEPRIVNVRSGAPGQGTDGTSFSGW